MIGIIDYNLGNIASVANALCRVGHSVMIVTKPEQLSGCSHAVLPGVGAFQTGMRNLEDLGFIDSITKYIESGKPFLGICLGMQLLFNSSEEAEPDCRGLGLVNGTVRSFESKVGNYIPHVGWNDVTTQDESRSLLNSGESFYFVHSYYCICSDKRDIDAKSFYGIDFDVSIRKENVFGVQFHPEKSHKPGLEFLKKFGDL